MKSKFIYHVYLIFGSYRSSWHFYLNSLRLARVQVRNFKKVIPHLISTFDFKEGDEYSISIDRFSVYDCDFIFPNSIYYLRKVVK